MRMLALLLATAGAFLSGCTEPDGEPDVVPREEHLIGIHGRDYDPKTLTMEVGEALRFENHETVAHTATAVASPMGELDSGDIAPSGGTHLFEDLEAGTYTFTCRHHSAMRLTVSVTTA